MTASTYLQSKLDDLFDKWREYGDFTHRKLIQHFQGFNCQLLNNIYKHNSSKEHTILWWLCSQQGNRFPEKAENCRDFPVCHCTPASLAIRSLLNVHYYQLKIKWQRRGLAL